MKLNDGKNNVKLNIVNEKLCKLFSGLSEVKENIQLCTYNTPDSVKLPLGYKVNNNLKMQSEKVEELSSILKELSDLI